MAIGTAMALGLGASALGGVLSRRGERKNIRQQNAYGQQASQQLLGMQQQGPSALEQQGMGMLGGGFDLSALLGGAGGGFNTGQDALMQALRTDPAARSAQTLQGIISGQGNPYDTSGLFSSLQALDSRNLDASAGDLYAGASGLGQRFGTAMRRSEVDLRRQALEDAAVRNQDIGMKSHGEAQRRLLDATGLLQEGDLTSAQQRLSIAGLLQEGGLGQAALQVQGRGQQGSLLAALLGAQGQRQGTNADLLRNSLAMGMPQGMPGYGDIIGQLGAAVPGMQMMQMLMNDPRYNPSLKKGK